MMRDVPLCGGVAATSAIVDLLKESDGRKHFGEIGCASTGCGGEGGCPVEVLVGNLRQASVVLVDSKSVYFADQGTVDGTVYQCPKSGCTTPTTLGPGYATGLGVDVLPVAQVEQLVLERELGLRIRSRAADIAPEDDDDPHHVTAARGRASTG